MYRAYDIRVPANGIAVAVRARGTTIAHVTGTATLRIRPRLGQRGASDEGELILLPGTWITLADSFDMLEVRNSDAGAKAAADVVLNIGVAHAQGQISAAVPVVPEGDQATVLYASDAGTPLTQAGVALTLEAPHTGGFDDFEFMVASTGMANTVYGAAESEKVPSSLFGDASPNNTVRILNTVYLANSYASARSVFARFARLAASPTTITGYGYQVSAGSVEDADPVPRVYRILGHKYSSTA